jgi:hypothetical protein
MNITRITACACFLFAPINFCFCSAEQPLHEPVDRLTLEKLRNAFLNVEIVIKYVNGSARVGIVPENGVTCDTSAKEVGSRIAQITDNPEAEQQIIDWINLGTIVVKSNDKGVFFGGSIAISQLSFEDIGSLQEFNDFLLGNLEIIGSNENSQGEGLLAFAHINSYALNFLTRNKEKIEEPWTSWAGTKAMSWLKKWR